MTNSGEAHRGEIRGSKDIRKESIATRGEKKKDYD
jgi:hypothetical protein